MFAFAESLSVTKRLVSSLAREFLREYVQSRTTQSEFAARAGMTGSNLSLVLSGDVDLSGRNLDKLLRGFATDEEKLQFIAAYLRDETPSDYADRITITAGEPGLVQETSNDPTSELLAGFAALPSKRLKQAVLTLLIQLRTDAEFRALFLQTMQYVSGQDDRVFTAANAAAKKRVDEATRDVAAATRGARG